MREIALIVIHHSASLYGCRQVIEEWHKQRGLKEIGYHFIINNGFPYRYEIGKEKDIRLSSYDGLVEHGRPIEQKSATERGYNDHSISICLIGQFSFTLNQFMSLKVLLEKLLRRFPEARVVGHRDLTKKECVCPGFDVRAYLNKFQIRSGYR